MVTTSNKTLFLRGLPAELVRDAKTAAARRGTTLTALVSEALAHSLRTDGQPAAPVQPDELVDDIAWYQANRGKLVKRYRDRYVAIVEAAVVDHDREFAALAARVFARFGRRSIYMPRVQPDETTVRVRSPRLTRR